MSLAVKNWITYRLKYNNLLYNKINEIESFFNCKNFEEIKNREFLLLLRKTYNNNQFYNTFYKENNVDLTKIKDYTEVFKLPILTKSLIKANTSKIKTNNKIYFKGYTSGTTGRPLVVYRTIKSIINENAYVWWYRIQSGLSFGDKKISLRGDLEKNRITYFDKFSNTLHISSFALNSKNILLIQNKIESFNPKAIIGYPSSINTLAILFDKQNIHVDVPLTFTSSETLFDFQQKNIEKVFKTKIFDWYGNSERTIALYKSNNLYFEPPMYAVNKYVNGKTLTSSLINEDFPLINYQVDDLIETDNKYDKLKLSIIINKIEGRNENFIELYDGSKVGTAALSLMFKEIDVLSTQIKYFEKGFFDINVVPGKLFNKNSLLKLKKAINSKLGKENKISINLINENEIVYKKSGKFDFIIKE